MYDREWVIKKSLQAKAEGLLKPKYQQMTDEELTARINQRADESDLRHLQENSKKE